MMRTRSSQRTGRPAQGGYILVAVLGVMLLLAGFVAAASLVVRSTLGTAKVENTETGMVGLTQGGIELTAYQLFVVKAAPALVDRRPIKFGGGTIVPHVGDEGGKADLNKSDPRLLSGVFRTAGLDGRTADALLARVLDMRGADRNSSDDGVSSESPPLANAAGPRSSATAEDRKRRGFQSVDQISDLIELSGSDMRALRSMLTVFNPDGKINIRSASPTMLDAIPGLSRAVVAVILERRDAASEKDLADLLGKLDGAQSFVKTRFGPAFTVRIDATSAKGRKKAVNAVVAASKSPNNPYYVLDWWE